MSIFVRGVGVACVALLVTADAAAETTPGTRQGSTGPMIATPTGVVISGVTTTIDAGDNSNVTITLQNWDAVDRDVTLNTDPKLGTPTSRSVHVGAHAHAAVNILMGGANIVNGKIVGTLGAELCGGTFAINLSLSGPNADTKPRKATHPVPVFETVSFHYGSVGPPPTDPNVVSHAVKLQSIVVDGGYVCGKKLALKLGIKNGSGITPSHLTARVFDAALAGAPAWVMDSMAGGPTNGGAILADSPIAIGGNETKDVIVTSGAVVTGSMGTISVGLHESSSELGSHLGYWRWASFTVREKPTVWKLD